MSEFWQAMDVWLPGVLVLAVLMLASGFFSGSETAMFLLSREELRRMQIGRPRQRLVTTLLRDPDRLLTAILFWNLSINLTYFAVSVVTTRRLVAADQTAAAGLFSVISLVMIIVFGEVLPKSLAVVVRVKLSELAVLPLSIAVRLLDPLMPLLATLTRALRRALYPKLKPEPFLDADDLERALETLPQEQSIVPYERQVLHRILDLSQITAEEIMRPRGSYVVWRPPVSLSQIVDRMKQAEYLFLQDDQPETIGSVVPLRQLAVIPEENLEKLAVGVVHVPWSAPASKILQLLHDRLLSVAVVVSEYGETVGVVTEEDILDTVLSLRSSRARRVLKREPVLEVAEGIWHVEGLTTLRYLAQRLGLDYDPDQDDSVTVGGLLQEEYERFPEVGDEIRWNGYTIRVFDSSGRGSFRAVVSRAVPDEPPDEA